MPLEERSGFDVSRTQVAHCDDSPVAVRAEYRRALRRHGDDHERDREMNQQRVQSPNHRHLPGRPRGGRIYSRNGSRAAQWPAPAVLRRHIVASFDDVTRASRIRTAVCRSRSRARDKVDMTVPMGTPSTSDISL